MDSLYLLASTLLSNSQQFLPPPNFSAFSPKDDFYKANNNALLQLLFSPTSLVTKQHSYLLVLLDGLPNSLLPSSKEPACHCRRQKKHGFDPWSRKMPWGRAWQPTPVFLPGVSHGQRSLVAFRPQSHKEQAKLRWLTMHAQLAWHHDWSWYLLLT